ncbi:MFS transporter [Alcaligenes endophyticus]|uniref:MFS transporter n=1 Tax=Alcaligenes endophyticus TaxID=1929088 RepID=A0ABT8EN13_9BURK|nr:MFS transporter [Alcaligenes endophyticus]MCX5591461.1 MFS transporter [Alcaligenes endophyticus]MDN4122658.1 MFS transporter [Alcaligenes endophyticus]
MSQTTRLADGLATPRRYWAALTLLLSLTITVLDSAMINVALPTIAKSLEIDPAAIVWVVIAYNLIVVVSLLPMSALAERIGFRPLFVLGLSIFGLASILSAMAESLAGLILARVLQGLGSAMLMCLFGGLTRGIYPLHKLGKGISLNAMTVGFMLVLGPTLGALLLEWVSWRWIFFANIPLCLLGYCGARFLPEPPRQSGRFDWLACLLSVPVFGLSIIGLDALVKQPLIAVLCFLLAGIAAWTLVRRSRDQLAPIVPVDLLRITPIAYAVGASAFSFAAQASAFVVLPFYFQQTHGYGYTEVGMLLGAWSVGMALMAPVAGVLSDRYAVAFLSGLGAAGIALGLGGVLLVPAQTHFAWLAAAMGVAGVGFGFFQTPNNRAMLAGAPLSRSGAAGGMQATTRVFGQSFGTTLVGLSFHLSTTYGASLGVGVAIACALAALVINVFRARSAVKDISL